MKDLKIIVPNNFKEFGNKVNEHINHIRETNQNYLVKTNLVRFNNRYEKEVFMSHLISSKFSCIPNEFKVNRNIIDNNRHANSIPAPTVIHLLQNNILYSV